ncbi:MAG: hypothetical protein KAI17_05210 [Thiotrichaceae bacterium]|nr:hypothetical protein [Thiotrichaceae bacterium]
MEHLFSTAKGTIDDPLNVLIEIISPAIEKYEATQEDIIAFETKANNSLLSSCNNQLIQCLVDL